MSQYKKTEHHLRPYKMAAQSLGLLICIFFMMYLAGSGMPDMLKGDNREMYLFLTFVSLSMAGYITTWFRESVGTVMVLLGALLLLIFFIWKKDIGLAIMYGFPFGILGTLFLIHLKKKMNYQQKVKQELH